MLFLFYSLPVWLEVFISFIHLSRKPGFGFIYCLSYSAFNSVTFCFHCYCLSSVYSGFNLLFFFCFLEMLRLLIWDFSLSLSIYCHQFPLKDHFNSIPHVLICYILISSLLQTRTVQFPRVSIIDFWFNSLRIHEDILYAFNYFKMLRIYFMTQNIFCLGECNMCPCKGCGFCLLSAAVL